ncbi:glycosyl hydrolase [Cohnella hashimotonis]|uniref:Glycosyl hydrolase n=1 Tax=Cohnella hashimotonis TaxID=2826895 RepID=A0ABT6TNF1_9BACL|nr:glycosyl hydrolase [Cohnella hashimotonis]
MSIISHIDDCLTRLHNPPTEAKGFTRWWWYGAAVTKEEVRRELTFMQQAGLGGVEIQITYPLQEDSEAQGIKNRTYYSPEFMDILDYTLATAEELGLFVDITLCSGWPFGGPFVPFDMAPEILIPYQIDLIGPTEFAQDFTTILPGEPIKAVMGKFENGALLPDTLRDITEHLGTTWLHGWQWGHCMNKVSIPEGHWKIYVFITNMYKQQVGIPAPGMEGYAIDHCRKDVSDFYFAQLGEPLLERLGRGRIRAFFCDSIELGGNNWTAILPEEFAARRGYELTPFMPALWGNIGEITADIRYDYYKTFSELTIDNFFRNFTAWSHARGVKTRIQAHGTWGDILQAYAAADYPEGETFGANDKYEVNTVHRRLASSAGHVYGRAVITNETFTWLRSPRFMETLEMMKAAVDAVFLDGINQIVNHGYSYSPESAGKPGWAFYASSFISHNNTWWEYYPILSAYIHTVSAFLQAGESYAEVGIYLPQADIWSAMPLAELHMAMKLEEHIGKSLVNRVQKSGYYFDFLNDEAVTQLSAATASGLALGANRYKVVILPYVTRLPLDTADKLLEFVSEGGTLIAVAERPRTAPGYKDRESNNRRLDTLMQGLFEREDGRWKTVGKGKTIVIENEDQLVTRLKEAEAPDVEIESLGDASGQNQAAQTVGYVHRIHQDGHVYFLANVSGEERQARIRFKYGGRSATVLDPLTRRTLRSIQLSPESGAASIELAFEPFQSLLVVFGEALPAAADLPNGVQDNGGLPEARQTARTVDISERWTLRIPEAGFEQALERLQTWEQFAEVQYYCGSALYEKKVTIPALRADQRVWLHLEDVREVAEVFVNGRSAGVLWKAPRRLDVTDWLAEGENALSIKVTNVWINHMLDPALDEPKPSSPLSESWPYFTEKIKQIRDRRLYAHKERQQVQAPLPSGLSGKATLEIVTPE